MRAQGITTAKYIEPNKVVGMGVFNEGWLVYDVIESFRLLYLGDMPPIQAREHMLERGVDVPIGTVEELNDTFRAESALMGILWGTGVEA